ncbi:MAG: ribosomal protein S18-alanine N-acetyltransferase [Rubrivivax sp.]|nr:ribosomal protein S18-alanine N-acetyltransferase [Rubrivivax sp.]
MNARLAPAVRRRAMAVRDIDAVVLVEASAYGFPWTRGNFVDSLAAGYVAELMENEAGEVLGYFLAMTGVDELHLLNITVAPAWQGLGLGRRLMADLEAQARALRVASVWLEVRASNLRARSLYERLGYTAVGLRKAYYPAVGRREDAVVMSLPLPDEDAAGAPHALD